MSPNRKPRAELSAKLSPQSFRTQRPTRARIHPDSRPIALYPFKVATCRTLSPTLEQSVGSYLQNIALKNYFISKQKYSEILFLYDFYIADLFLNYFYLYYLIKQALSEREDSKEGVCVFLKERVKKQEKKIYKRKEQRNEKEKH